MTEHPDPGGEAAARAAQLAAMSLSVAEAIARLRAQRLNSRAEDERRADAARRATDRAQAAHDALQYRQALADDWLRQQDTRTLLERWHTAMPHVAHDPVARLATMRIEERLRRLHPEAMDAYDRADLPQEQRMECAMPLLRGPFGLDPVGTPPDLPEPVPARPAEAPDVVRQAYPVSTAEAMRTAPTAAKRSVLAITAGPVRKQITATPHIPRSAR